MRFAGSLIAVIVSFVAPVSAGHAEGAVTISVPDDYQTIQEAVDAAAPGSVVLVAGGVYNETVSVVTDDVTIRGVDRNEVILDGEFQLDNGVWVLSANGVAVENLTVRNYAFNGVLWGSVDGFRGSYLTAHRNGDYGIYAYGSVNGMIEHSYASGSPDAGFYVGQCHPCTTTVTDVHGEYNGAGYQGTNAGGDLVVTDSTFNNNRVGMLVNSGTYELCYPQREAMISGNEVYSNNEADAPTHHFFAAAHGNGIFVVGGVDNTITGNRVRDHDETGIALVPFVEQSPTDFEPSPEKWVDVCDQTPRSDIPTSIPRPQLWDSYGNDVTDNLLEDNRVADLAVASADQDVAGLDNCFSGNTFATSAPERLEALAPCDGEGTGDWSAGEFDLDDWLTESVSASGAVDYETADIPEPPPQENMPGA